MRSVHPLGLLLELFLAGEQINKFFVLRIYLPFRDGNLPVLDLVKDKVTADEASVPGNERLHSLSEMLPFAEQT